MSPVVRDPRLRPVTLYLDRCFDIEFELAGRAKEDLEMREQADPSKFFTLRVQ